MKKNILCLLFIISTIFSFSLIPNILFISPSKNEITNIGFQNQYFKDICLAKESKIIIILQINNKYMTVNGVKKEIDPGRGTVPVIIKGRTLVPIRAIIEELGGTIDWDGNAKKVTIKFKTKKIELWIDKTIAKVDGTIKELDVAPQIINGRTMLPVRFVTEELGCIVDWNDKTKTITITYEEKPPQVIDKLSSSGEKVFTSAGGELTLSDGTKLSVPKNAFSKSTKVTLKSIINPSFSCIDTLGFELTGLKDLKGEITLSVNGKKDLKNEELNVFGYDFEDDGKIDLKYSYVSDSGITTVKINPLASTQTQKNNQSNNSFLTNKNSKTSSSSEVLEFKDKLSAYIGWTPYYTPKSREKIIRTPYYSQIGGSCAATSAQMLLKKSDYDTELFNVLKDIKASDANFGLDAYQYANDLRDYLSAKTGYPVIHIPYFGIPHLKWRVLSELDKGHPVILNLGEHAVLVVGYTDNGNSLIIHDPQGVSTVNDENGTMYTARSWDWIKNVHWSSLEKYYILYADGPFATGTNVTVECPGKSESGGMQGGDLSFYALNASNKLFAKYGLQIKPSAADGYIWTNASNDKVDYIGTDSEVLRLSIPIFNASDKNRNAELKVAVEEDNGSGAPGKTIASFEQNYSIGAAKLNTETKATYKYDFKLADIRNLSLSDSNGKQKIFIHAYLHVDGDTKTTDSFMVKATLDVTPKVTSITPTSGKVGDTITINGFSFGKTKSSKSRVTINGKNVDIVSWSDKIIKVRLPQDVSSGPVIVYTGEKYEYESNKDVKFTKKSESECGKANGTYQVYFKEVPEWNDYTCKWQKNYTKTMVLTFKDGKIFNNGPKALDLLKVSGTYNDSEVSFTFTDNDPETDDKWGRIITGSFTGSFMPHPSPPPSPYRRLNCYFEGIVKGTVRAYGNNLKCGSYDETTELSVKMHGILIEP